MISLALERDEFDFLVELLLSGKDDVINHLSDYKSSGLDVDEYIMFANTILDKLGYKF